MDKLHLLCDKIIALHDKMYLRFEELLDQAPCLLGYHEWRYFKTGNKNNRMCLKCGRHEKEITYHIKDWIKEERMGRVYTDWRTLPDDPNRVGDEDFDPNPKPRYEIDPDEEYEKWRNSDEYESWSETVANDKDES